MQQLLSGDDCPGDSRKQCDFSTTHKHPISATNWYFKNTTQCSVTLLQMFIINLMLKSNKTLFCNQHWPLPMGIYSFYFQVIVNHRHEKWASYPFIMCTCLNLKHLVSFLSAVFFLCYLHATSYDSKQSRGGGPLAHSLWLKTSAIQVCLWDCVEGVCPFPPLRSQSTLRSPLWPVQCVISDFGSAGMLCKFWTLNSCRE